jgi:hypothetical protein
MVYLSPGGIYAQQTFQEAPDSDRYPDGSHSGL